MPTTPRGRSGLLVLLLALLPLAWGTSATAHSALIDSTPESGATLDALPEQVELRFNESLSSISPALIIRRDSTTVATLEPEIDGASLSGAPPSDLPDGDYTMVWRVVSGDGHPIDGVVPFTLGGTGREPASTSPTEEQTPDSAASSDTTAAETGWSTTSTIMAATVLLALLLTGVALLVRRRRTHPTNPKDLP